MAYRLTSAAENQIQAVLIRSAQAHGADAASRYEHLINLAMTLLGNHPELPGSSTVPGSPKARLYPLRHSRNKMPPQHRVRQPRHRLIYRITEDGSVEILGIVHDRMLLSRAIPQLFQNRE